ncbi:metallophosphoesterase 1-like [Nilaparvata lugens]|uniref:metallophosphoesterase 1-like n=3 Tax=Nilaparvata lugens TaxID=108931 RepID=UPI000B980993|nr:metallophosphoesterase 1-like [Nilaparvata lugens]XP_039279956.1 metallophosphoesterase 1-like [Nilaparvata lugens]XP_039279958.1 metallophosphoesterase 1-like [Nilaparvata lugens]
MMNIRLKYVTKIVACILSLIFICEYVIYYVIMIQCWWPDLSPDHEDKSIPLRDGKEIKVMMLADTHLLGSRKGHWFDKLRREWQMYRAFQTAISLHSPDVVFVLGDLFDEGLWCSDAEFTYYVQRFHSLFHVPPATKIFGVVGNHDIGFHYGITPYLQDRFTRAFNMPSVKLISLKGNHFILINSMAMEGDGCFLCRPAEVQINKIIARLQCTKGIGNCSKGMALRQYSRPILLQHFPLYRESDSDCNEPDEAPEDEKKQKFRERWECLSKESSEFLLFGLKPRLVVDGHTHHGCYTYHTESDTHEFTIPSFSWRNKDNPSFMMAVLSPNNYAVSKCYIPRESTIIKLYIGGMLVILVAAFLLYPRHSRRAHFFKIS